jgi:hypothetical protein
LGEVKERFLDVKTKYEWGKVKVEVNGKQTSKHEGGAGMKGYFQACSPKRLEGCENMKFQIYGKKKNVKVDTTVWWEKYKNLEYNGVVVRKYAPGEAKGQDHQCQLSGKQERL